MFFRAGISDPNMLSAPTYQFDEEVLIRGSFTFEGPCDPMCEAAAFRVHLHVSSYYLYLERLISGT